MSSDLSLPPGTGMLTGAAAEATKAAATQQRAELTRQKMAMEAEVAAAREAMDAKRKELEVEFQLREAALRAQLEPLQAELAKLTEVAWTVDLYLGREEEVTLLTDGEPAPADTPITIRQLVLAADEESLVLLDSGGVDFRSINSFVEWLIESPENRDRIIPDLKGVVVVIPSRQHRDYKDPWLEAVAQDANRQAHWIIRNGERLYLLRTDPSLVVDDRLTPKRDEFVEFFTRNGRPMEPGSAEWMKAEKQADSRRRHFMRIFLVLQGLIDRSVCFHPLPEGGVNLLSVSSQDSGKVVIVNELDNVLTDGREPFRQWQARLNAQMRPGLRVVGAFGLDDFNAHYESKTGEHRRLTPRRASFPPTGKPLLIEARQGNQFVVRYQRTDEVWNRNVPVPPTRRASCTIQPSDKFILPYDLATEEDLLYYLNRRADRRGYLNMVPVIKAALVAKRTEREQEGPFRAYLTQRLVAEHDADPETVQDDLARLVDWWKLANKWARPLVGDGPQQAKAATAIIREWTRQKAGTTAGDEAAVAAAQRALSDLLWVSHTPSSGYRAYTASGVADGPWVTIHGISRTGKVTMLDEWTTIPSRTLATARTVWESDEWTTWTRYPDLSTILTGPERSDLISAARDHLVTLGATPIAVTEKRAKRCFTAYGWVPGTDLAEPGEKLEDHLVSVQVHWTREDRSIATSTSQERHTRWVRYSESFSDPGTPWRDPDSRYFNRNNDHVQVWLDAEQVDMVAQVRDFISRRARDRWDEAESFIPATTAGREALYEAWLERQKGLARARFVEDFGAQSEDIWEHHWGTLNVARKWREPTWAWALFNRLARNGIAYAGKTVAELVELDTQLHTGTPIDPGPLGDLRLP